MILTPDGMTAKSFVESEKGQAWKALSDELGIATVYVEPQDGRLGTLICRTTIVTIRRF